MKTIVASIIRNEGKRLKVFLDSCDRLEKTNDVYFIFIVGPSEDDTLKEIKNFKSKRTNVLLIEEETDNPLFKHDKSLERTKVFAKLRNDLLILAKRFKSDSVLMIDANILFDSNLINTLNKTDADIVAPIVLYDLSGRGLNLHPNATIFYDVWAFRKNGKNFNSFYPYCDGINLNSNEPFFVDSVGACFLIKKQVLDANIIFNGDTDCEHVSFCNDAIKNGFKIALNTSCYVYKQRK